MIISDKERNYHQKCPICKNYKLKYWFKLKGFTIVKCRECGVSFVKDIVTQKELDYHYGADLEVVNPAGDSVYLKEQNIENLKYFYRKLKSLIVKKVPKGKLLDVGCNAGLFLDVMDGFDRYGVERSTAAGMVAKEKYGDKIFIGTFEDYKAPEVLFDCISVQDVLDHMTNPVEVMNKCNKLLKSGGLLVVKVHDMSCLYAKFSGKKFYALVPPSHLFFFNRTSLTKTLEKASFKVLFFKHLAHRLFLSTVFFRLSREGERKTFYKLYRALEGTFIGKIMILYTQ